jgi:superfamily II DNA or RNA helicase
MSTAANQLAPGSRIRLRDEEWLIQRIDSTRDSASRVFEVVGLSPLVEGRPARFIEDIEKDRGDGIEIIDPRLTEPIKEKSPFYRDTRLMLESQLRSSCPNDSTIHIGHQGAMDLLPFQLDPTLQALSQPRQRILIADTVGLGKTIECGILLSELIKRGAARRILVVAVKSMLTQFQKELWSRFSLPLTRLDSASLQSVRRKIPTNHNPFHYYDRSIISIDTLKQDGEYRNHLESAHWDVIVIDEAHNVAERSSNSQRSRVAKLLANRSDSLILLSATPHDGSRESFASLMNMLNPTAIKDPQNYGPDDIDGLFIRRFKKDVRDQIAGNFPDRVVHTPKAPASPEEESAYAHLFEMAFSSIDQKRSGAKILFRTLLEKALFSSPAACLSTIAERIKRLEKRDDTEAATDISALRELANTITEITPEKFTKYQNLLSLLKPTGSSTIGWSPKDASDRLVIFTERIDTLKFLQTHLPPALKLKDKQVAILHGSLSDIEQQEIVEGFGSADSPIRLLIASDVASEGINLHHQSHRLIHFDIPWSLLTFQQRNGRIDRYGQTFQPEIYYLLTESSHEKIRGDLRILELLTEKDQEVQANIGDPTEFTGIHTKEEEEIRIASVIESDVSPEKALDQAYSASSASDDWFDMLAKGLNPYTDATTTPTKETVPTADLPSFYRSDYDWAAEGFEALKKNSRLQLRVETHPNSHQIDISIPEDLRRRLKKYPSEILNDTGLLSLTTDRDRINKEIIRCRAHEGQWPALHLLWEQHPALSWMQNKLLSRFGRHQASCIHLDHLTPGERIVLGTGIIPNRRGRPVIQRWYGVRFIDGTLKETLTLEGTIERTRFIEDHPNPDMEIDTTAVQSLFDETIDCLTIHLSEARDEFRAATRPELDRQLAKLSSFLSSRQEMLDLDDSQDLSSNKQLKLAKKEAAQRDLQNKHDDYKSWITNTMKTEDAPSIRLFAVFGNFSQ